MQQDLTVLLPEYSPPKDLKLANFSSLNMKFTLLSYQVSSAEQLFQGIHTNTPKLLVAPTRCGKTYTIAAALRKAQEYGHLKSPNKMTNILFLTIKSVKRQSQRVLTAAGVKSIHVDNYASLGASLGALYIDWIKDFNKGEFTEYPVWREEDKPDVIICDECQLVKNPSSTQSRIIQAAAKSGILLIFVSATPFPTLAQAKALCLALRVCTESTWKQFITAFTCQGKTINEYSPQGSKNLINYLERLNLVVRFEGVVYPHKVFNKCVTIEFGSKEKRLFYEKAYEDYLEECRKNNKNTPDGIRARWVAMQKFRVRAEDARKEELGDYAYLIRTSKQRQVIVGSNFLETLRGVWHQLVKIHKVDPKRIGFVVGGQPELERQKFIDLFQAGKIDYILLTLKSGGAGISLHHEFKQALPRHCVLPPTWSPIELVQVLGRAHGPTSLSTTHQDVLWMKDTIEEDVAVKVALGFKCLAELVNKNATWVNLFNKLAEEDAEEAKEEYNKLQQDVDEETGDNILFDPSVLDTGVETIT